MRDPFSLTGTAIAGRYLVESPVGEGGFGLVYRGVHEALRHPIAIKCLKIPAHFTPEAKAVFLERFREEARILVKLGDAPGVTRIYDFGVHEHAGHSIPFVVLEWLDGQTLQAMLAARRAAMMSGMRAPAAIELLLPAVDALAVAHESRVAHRDIKPANLFLASGARGPVVKVLDFGIAKALEEGEWLVESQTRTPTQFRAFTAGYAAPEQFSPKRFGGTGPWTDVHALGLVLVELLTDKPANRGRDKIECLESATSAQRPSPRGRGAAVSDELEAAVLKALALQPEDRFADAGQLAKALRRTPEMGAAARPAPTAHGEVKRGGTQPTALEAAARSGGSRVGGPTLNDPLGATPSTVRAAPLQEPPPTMVGPMAVDVFAATPAVSGNATVLATPVADPGFSVRRAAATVPVEPLDVAMPVRRSGTVPVAPLDLSTPTTAPAPSTQRVDTERAVAPPVPPPVPTSPARPGPGPRPLLYAFGAFAVAGIGAAAYALAAKDDGKTIDAPARAHHAGSAPVDSAPAPSAPSPLETVLAAGVLRGKALLPVAVLSEADARHTNHYRVTREAGKITKVVRVDSTGMAKESQSIDYPADGGYRIVVEDGRGVLVETIRMTNAGVETHYARSGLPYVLGCARLVWKFDDAGRPVERTCQSSEGHVVIDATGCQLQRRVFDENNLEVERRCFRDDGGAQADSDGHHLVKISYDSRGRKIEQAYFGVEGGIATLLGCARTRFENDAAGNESAVRCVGPSGSPAPYRGTKIAGITRTHDEHGCETKVRYVDVDDRPLSLDGVSGSVMVRSPHCDLLVMETVDQGGRIVAGEGGPARREMTVDAQGNATEVRCFDAKGSPMNCEAEKDAGGKGSVLRRTFDDRGRVTSNRAFDGAGKPSVTSRHYPHESRLFYDDRGLHVETTWFDAEGKPVPALGTVARRAFRYDALGSLVSFSSFGADGKPVVAATGAHEIRMTYDDRHRMQRVELFDASGKYPTVTSLIYGGVEWPSGAVRLEIEREPDRIFNTFFDKNGRKLSSVDCRDLEKSCMR